MTALRNVILTLIVAAPMLPLADAGEVTVLASEFLRLRSGDWRVSSTLAHADAGWEHYADAWRVVGEDGRVLGTRVLYHPHEAEQPFTRSLDGVKIPSTMKVVFVEAHDSVHGWSPRRLRVDLSTAVDDRLRVER